MKRNLLLLIILILSLTACSAAPEAGQSPPPSQTVTALPAAPSSTPSATPAFVPDTDIPDIVWGEEEPAIHSDCHIYDDGNYIYFSEGPDYSSLYSYCKSDGSIQHISTEESSRFTLCSGKVYFIECTPVEDEESPGTIISYDPKTGEKKKLKSLDNQIWTIYGYKGKLYFKYTSVYDEEAEEQTTDLYTINTDGSGMKKIKSGVASFSIYEDKIYYLASPYGEGSALNRCDLNGNNSEQISECASWVFTLGNGKLFYCDIDENQEWYAYLLDLASNSKIPMEFSYNRVFAGQYIIYLAQQDSDTISYIYAYDLTTGKTYKCLELGDSDYTISVTAKNVYIDYYDDNGSTAIDRLIVKNGKASLESVKAIENGSGEDNEEGGDYSDAEEVPPFKGFTDPNDSTVVIADSDGMVYFGYSDGKWLTHSQAAAYCGKKMNFYKISLKGANGYITSSGAAENPDRNWDESSWANNGSQEIYDGNNSYLLKFNHKPKSMSCHIDPARIPKASALKDTSSLLPRLQTLADKQFGANKVKVKITSAVSVDYDGDGKKEIIANASNNEYGRYDFLSETPAYWYSIACVIEDDGSYAFIEERYEKGLKEDSGFTSVEGVLDIDGDGVCEFILYCEGWEFWGIYACHLENGKLVAAVGYDWCV